MDQMDFRVRPTELEDEIVPCKHEHAKYFHEVPGKEHYCLIRHLAKQFQNSLLVDIGTHIGLSALALSTPTNEVVTFDIVDLTSDGPVLPESVQKRLLNLVHYPSAFPLHAKFAVLDIDPHDGDAERKLVEQISTRGWNGWMLCDDIYLNDAMKAFWYWACNNTLLRCTDLTPIGHITGSGLIQFL